MNVETKQKNENTRSIKINKQIIGKQINEKNKPINLKTNR